MLYTASKDKSVRAWDVRTPGRAARTHIGHRSTVKTVQISNGALYSGSWDYDVRRWGTRSERCEMVFSGHSGRICAISLSAGQLYSSSTDHSARSWDAHGTCTAIFKGHTRLVSGLKVAGGVLFTASEDMTVRSWCLSASERPTWVLDGDKAHCTTCETKFHLFLRRHHCRSCGMIFCDACSSKRIAIPALGYRSAERVCTACYWSLKGNPGHLSGMMNGQASRQLSHSSDRVPSPSAVADSVPMATEVEKNSGASDSNLISDVV